MNRALANIGNTHTQTALLTADGPGPVHCQPTAELLQGSLPPLLADNDTPVLAATVVPAAREHIDAACTGVTWLHAGMDLGLDFSGVDTASFGADRVANCLAAAAVHLPVIVVDCGTAITTEVVSADGRVLGGVILPGRALARRALHRGTAQLPEVPLAHTPPTVLGRDTQAAIQAGVDTGLLGALTRILEDSRRALEGTPRVLVAGGDAAFFVDGLRAAGVEAAPPDLTLRGLAAAATQIKPP